MSAPAEILVPSQMVLGEGPIRVGQTDGFACVDIRRGEIHSGTLASGITSSRSMGGTVGSIAEMTDGRLLAAHTDQIVVIDGEERITVQLPEEDIRFNDGKSDPVGRFVCGTMADPPRSGAGSLWSFESGAATRIVDGVTISNGLCWSPEGTTMYYIDTPTMCIDAFDYDLATGAASERRTLIRLPNDIGSPDGMTIDCDGRLWVAFWGGGALRCYSAGVLNDVVEVPTPYVTCPAFVGTDSSILLITTASEPNPRALGAGALYVAEPGVTGLPVAAASPIIVFGSAS